MTPLQLYPDEEEFLDRVAEETSASLLTLQEWWLVAKDSGNPVEALSRTTAEMAWHHAQEMLKQRRKIFPPRPMSLSGKSDGG